MPDQLEAIVQRMIDAGEPEDAIASVIQAYPATQTPGVLARQQSQEQPGVYLREMVSNIPGDLVETGKGLVGVLATGARATAELGQNVAGVAREFVGLEPNYTDMPNARAIGNIPGDIVSHYAGYLDPDERAVRVRDRPVSTLVDIAAATGAVRGGAARARPAARLADRAVRGTQRFIEAHPAAQVAAGGIVGGATGGIPGVILGMAGGRPTAALIKLATKALKTQRGGPAVPPAAAATTAPVSSGASQQMIRGMSRAGQDVGRVRPSAQPAATAQDALRQELSARNIDWRTTDAVPIDAITRDISRPGGSILEAGESRIGLGERLAEALGRAEKAKTPAAAEAALTEARRLAKAARQRMHIAEKQAR